MNAQIGIIMGSKSDWDTMRHACETLDALGVAYNVKVVSAHRTPDLLFEYAGSAVERGLKVIIAGAGGAAHLPGMVASIDVLSGKRTVLDYFWQPIARTKDKALRD